MGFLKPHKFWLSSSEVCQFLRVSQKRCSNGECPQLSITDRNITTRCVSDGGITYSRALYGRR